MELENCFEVDLPPEKAWAVLLDIDRVATCMPGAELIEIVDELTYRGKVSVRLGPVALSFNGTIVFEEMDAEGKRAQVKAEGTDSKGRGSAAATVVFRLEPAGVRSKIIVKTDLNLSGSVAQYGRSAGLIQSIAGQLMRQFSDNLQVELSRTAEGPYSSKPPAMPSVKSVPLFLVFGTILKNWLTRLFGRAYQFFCKK